MQYSRLEQARNWWWRTRHRRCMKVLDVPPENRTPMLMAQACDECRPKMKTFGREWDW